MRLLAPLLLISLIAAAQPAAPPKIRTLLITGEDVPGHMWRLTSPQLRKALEDTNRFDVRVTEDFRTATAATLAPYDLVVVNYFDRNDKSLWWGEPARQALIDHVKNGKGLVIFHFSLAAFNGWEEWEKMSGGNWRPNNGHHSPSHAFTVEIKDADHPITRGLRAKFRQPYDELYANLKWQPEGSYHVLATAWDDHKLYVNPRQPTPGDGMHHPMLWTVPYGKGRVFVTALGHDVASVQTVPFVTTFTRGAEWAATGDVTLPVPRQMQAKPEPLPEPRHVLPGKDGSAPADAVVLFDGRDTSGFQRRDGSATGCTAERGEMVCVTGAGDAVSKEKFRSAQFHVEVLIPEMPDQKGQLKGNSGIYLQGITEVQVLDSYRNPTYAMGYLGAIYEQYPPLVNAARPPGQWATYDIIYNAPVCNERGLPLKHATMTVLVNGVLVQNEAQLTMRQGMCEPGPLLLQDHSGFPGAPKTEMRFRNIWARRLE
jgi:type 1 glutamine amidotransferase